MDQRAQIIDGIARLVPIREIPREHDQVALMTAGGAVLLDGKAAVLEFTPVHTIVPEMTQAAAACRALHQRPPDGHRRRNQPCLCGELAGLFAVRDELAVSGQARLDAMARDLCRTLRDPALDATLAPGDPGLFTDGGTAFLAANEVGLSSRLQLKRGLSIRRRGGAVFRLRDGLGAASPGPSGNAALLVRPVRPPGRGAAALLCQLFARQPLSGRADRRAAVVDRVPNG